MARQRNGFRVGGTATVKSGPYAGRKLKISRVGGGRNKDLVTGTIAGVGEIMFGAEGLTASKRNPSSSRKATPSYNMHYDGLTLVIQGNHVTVYDDDGYRFDRVGSEGAFHGKNAVKRAQDAIDRESRSHKGYKSHPGLGVKVKRSNGKRRNGKKPTYAAARMATWKAFGAAGWDLSSPNLKVIHATSPWGDVRLWFKAQAILVERSGPPWRVGDARTLSYDLDLRNVTDYPAFVRGVGKRLKIQG